MTIPADKKRKRRKWRQFRRRVIRTLALIIFICVGFGAFLARFPFASHRLDRQVCAAWRRATGLDLRFGEATYHLAQGRLDLKDIEVSDPESPTPPASLKRLQLNWRWLLLEPSVLLELDSVVVDSPPDLTLLMGADGQLRVSERTRSLADLLQRLADKARLSSSSSQEKAIQVQILGTNLYLDRTEAGTTQSPAEATSATQAVARRVPVLSAASLTSAVETVSPVAVFPEPTSSSLPQSPALAHVAGVEGLKLDLFLFPSLHSWFLKADGSLVTRQQVTRATPAPSLHVVVQPQIGMEAPSGPSRFSFSAEMDRLDSVRDWGQGLPFSLSATPLRVAGSVSPREKEGGVDLNLEVQSDVVRVQAPGAGLDLPETRLRADVALQADWTSGTVRVVSANAEALGATLQAARGEISLTGDRPFSVEIPVLRLDPQAMNLALARVDQETSGTQIERGSLETRVRLAGDRNGLNWDACEGQFKGNGLEGKTGWVAPVLGPLRFEAALSSRTLELQELDAQSGRNRLNISGLSVRREGATWRDKLSVRANWSCDVWSEDIPQLIPRRYDETIKDWKTQGQVTGFGTIRGVWTPGGGEGKARQPFLQRLESALNQLEIAGSARVEKAGVYHPVLPAPLENLAGSVNLSNREVTWTNLEGTLLGSKLTLTGQLAGKKVFWKEPALTLQAKGDLDLSRIPQILDAEGLSRTWVEEHKRDILKTLHPQGKVHLDVGLQGPLNQPAQLVLQGEVTARGLAGNIATPAVQGDLAVSSARLLLRPDGLTLENLKARLGTLDLNTNATLGREGLRVEYAANGRLPDYKTTFPPLLADSGEVAGDARVSGWAAIRPKPGSAFDKDQTPVAFFLAMAQALRESGNDGQWFKNTFAVDAKATADVKDCLYTHLDMPIPVRHITGRLFLSPDGLRSDGFVKTQWGDSPVGETSGTILVVPTERGTIAPPGQSEPDTWYVRIRYAGRFPQVNVDEWVRPWGRPAEPGAPPTPPLGPFEFEKRDRYERGLDVEGTVTADRVLYQNYEFQNALCQLRYRHFTGRPKLLEFPELKGQLCGGPFASDLALLFGRTEEVEWNWRVAVRNIVCERLLEAFQKKKSTINGRLTAQMGLQGRSNRRDSYRGVGSFNLADSSFMGNRLLGALGRFLRLEGLEQRSFTQANGVFAIQDSSIAISRLNLKGTVMDLVAEGTASFDRNLDLMVVYTLLNEWEKIPVLNVLPKTFEFVGGKVLKIQMSGSLDDPKIRTVPLSFIWKPAIKLPESPDPAECCPLLPGPAPTTGGEGGNGKS